ncbi:NfeD family protein [Marinoscillum sp. MHG1-6]|uniref:NfeD family protein n=1 Tax=Marinoscillum sp. MHG1-6 TaxID=2959627 RepID=UPI00215709A4|nr:NfeD family protein [Marinoscillum sp. MHG1-6]
MDWLTVIGLIVFGIALIVVEVVFIPGTTVVGILGFLISGYGIYLGYDYFGQTTGSVVLAGASLIGFGIILYALKSGAWQKFSLKEVNAGRTNEDQKVELNVGDEGVMVSSAKPVGKARFELGDVEVRSKGSFITEETPVKIVRIESNKIFVEPIN